jgi:hypothetical protein
MQTCGPPCLVLNVPTLTVMCVCPFSSCGVTVRCIVRFVAVTSALVGVGTPVISDAGTVEPRTKPMCPCPYVTGATPAVLLTSRSFMHLLASTCTLFAQGFVQVV